MTRPTTRDQVQIDLDGSIDAAIATLKALKKEHPGGEISLETDYEYGESYARLYLRYTRPKEPVEIELGKWQEKRQRYEALVKAARTYEAEGDTYPRAAELAKLREELGSWADAWGSLTIFDGQVLLWDMRGACTRDGKWPLRTMCFDIAQGIETATADETRNAAQPGG